MRADQGAVDSLALRCRKIRSKPNVRFRPGQRLNVAGPARQVPYKVARALMRLVEDQNRLLGPVNASASI